MRGLSKIKVTILTSVVIVSFIFSSLGWRQYETEEGTRLIIAALILIVMYLLMIFELVNRNLAALIGASAAVAAHDCLIDYVEMEEILKWEDLETLALLFGMMIIVNVLSESGLFNFLAIWSYSKSNGRFWLLITIMSFITAFLSAFIDNVSTMLLMSPTLIKLSELEHIDPRYVLMIMVIFCNIGGSGTPVGDPPNLIIINDPLTTELGITFSSFIAYCGPCVLLTIAIILVYLKLVYKSKESFRQETYTSKVDDTSTDEDMDGIATSKAPNTIDQLTSELRVLQGAQAQLDDLGARVTGSTDLKLRQELEQRINWLEDSISDLKFKQSQLSIEFDNPNLRRGSRFTDAEIAQLMRTYSIKSKPILIQSLVVLTATILLFFIQSLPGTHLTLGWISIFAGLTLLVMSSSVKLAKNNEQNDADEDDKASYEHGADNLELVISKIEWSTLMFFFALFIVMEVMAKLGLIQFMGKQVTNLIDLIPDGQMRSIGAITIILWASGLASACIDNVPFTSMMIKVLGTIVVESRSSGPSQAELPVKPLIFALVFGSCFGGNGSLIGASANLVTAGVAGRFGYPITFNGFLKFCAPVTIISLVTSNIYLVFVFVVWGL